MGRRGVGVAQAGAAMKLAAGVAFVTPEFDAVLLAKRSRWVSHPGTWAVPGGGVEPGETALQGALREVEEELGLDRHEVIRRCDFLTSIITEHRKTFVTFVAVCDPEWLEQNVELDHRENTSLAWFPLSSSLEDEPMHYGMHLLWPSLVAFADSQVDRDTLFL